MLGLFLFTQLMDSATFLLAYHRWGMQGESSAIPRQLFEIGGVAMIIEVKLIAVLFISLILVWLSSRNTRDAHNAARLGYFGCIIVGLFGIISNALAVVI